MFRNNQEGKEYVMPEGISKSGQEPAKEIQADHLHESKETNTDMAPLAARPRADGAGPCHLLDEPGPKIEHGSLKNIGGSPVEQEKGKWLRALLEKIDFSNAFVSPASGSPNGSQERVVDYQAIEKSLAAILGPKAVADREEVEDDLLKNLIVSYIKEKHPSEDAGSVNDMASYIYRRLHELMAGKTG